MKWSEVVKDPRYINASPERKRFVQEDWYEKNITADPRYKSELDAQIRQDLFGIKEPPTRAPSRIAPFLKKAAQPALEAPLRFLTPLTPYQLFKPTPEEIQIGERFPYYTQAQAAFKWAASGMPEEDPERFKTMSWSDVIRESYPMLKDPKSRLARSTTAQFGAELGGTLLDIGTRPSTYIAWGALERLIPPVLRTVFRKLPRGTQEALIKERFIWGRHPIDLAYKEFGLKTNAPFESVRTAYRKAALRWHPDKAPPGQAINYTRRFLRIQGAYDKIKASQAVVKEATKIVKRPPLPPPKVKPTPPTKPLPKPPKATSSQIMRAISGKTMPPETIIASAKEGIVPAPIIKSLEQNIGRALTQAQAAEMIAGVEVVERPPTVPFTKDQVDAYNRYTHFPIDINTEYQKEINSVTSEVQDALNRYGIEKMPEELSQALTDYKSAVKEYYLKDSQIRSYAPPPSVVGPAKYPVHKIAKADKMREKNITQLEKARKKIDVELRKVTGTLLPKADIDRWLSHAQKMTKVQFGKFYAEEMKREADPTTGYGQQVKAGTWDHVFRGRGRKLYDDLQKVKPKPTPPVKPPTEPTPEYIGKELATDKAGFITTETLLDPIKKPFHIFYDWLWTFGKQKRLDPALYDKFMASYHGLTARINEAIKDISRLLPKKQLTLAERVKTTYGVEEKDYKVPKDLEATKEAFSRFYQDLENVLKEAQIFKSGFIESKIAYNKEQIAILKNKIDLNEGIPAKAYWLGKWKVKLNKLANELQQLQVLSYLPHKIVAKAVIENKLAKMGDDRRIRFLNSVRRLSFRYKHRRGVIPLRTHVEAGLLNPADVDIVKLSMEAASEAKFKLIMKDLFDYGKEKGYIVHKLKKDAPATWNNLNPIMHGIIAPEYQNYKIHPLFEAGLMEMKSMLTTSRNPLKKFMSLVKIGQFYNPKIIWKYDFIQQAIGGAYGVKTPYYLARSVIDRLFRSDLYLEAEKNGTFSRPYLPGMGSRGEKQQIELAARRTLEDLPFAVKTLEGLIGVPFTKENAFQFLLAPYKAIWNLTWAGDEVIRLSSYRHYKAVGYDDKTAGLMASNWHGAYSEISKQAKSQLSNFFFVYSFRFLMPRQLWRLVYEPTMMSYNKVFKGKPSPTRDWVRVAKGLTAAILIPALYHWHLRRKGFKTEAPLWKYSKQIDGSEVVAGINTIINMPLKWAARLLRYDPIKEEPRLIQGAKSWGKWELHPVYRITMDIRDNRKSIGYGEVYNPNLKGPQKALKMTEYFITESFRILKTFTPKDAEEERGWRTWRLTKQEQEELINQTMTDFDKLLINTLGYIYVRPDKDYYFGLNQKRLISEYRRRIKKVKSDEEAELVEKWYDRVLDILERRYDQ